MHGHGAPTLPCSAILGDLPAPRGVARKEPQMVPTPVTMTFIIVLAAFAAAWISLDVLLATGVI